MKWTEIAVEVEVETEEIISNYLYEVGADALSIEDPFYLENVEQDPLDWDYIDESLVDTRGKRIVVKAYFSEDEKPGEKLEKLKKLMEDNEDLDPKRHRITLKEVEEKDWAENWKKYYKPTRIGETIVIKPSWEDYEEKPGDIVIEIDPGMAFGTGTHETTSMCSFYLEKYLDEDYRVYDIGTGSGILSMVAAKLGAKKVYGVDLDEKAVEVARENIKNLGLEDRVEILHGNLLDLLEEPVELIVSNIMADIIIGMTEDVRGLLKDGGIFISSGIILAKVDPVVQALEDNGFEVLEVKRLNEWACIVAKK